ncbi:MAG: hypothetical protein K2N79_02445 [Muribaculaceae bacterium]|nr:hypothetical protein [Muribaculaceae bacterium]
MKLTQRIIFLLVGISLLPLSGCNSDIFLSEPPLNDETLKATIDGDGGEVEFHIPVKGLEYISLNQVSSLDVYCTYLNVEGDTIDSSSPASEVSKIEFESDFYKFEIEKNDGNLIVKSICNTSSYETVRTIMLQYTYGYRFIDINILPGKELKLVETFYYHDLVVKERTATQRYRFFNGGHLAQTIEFMPYLNERANLFLDPERESLWVCANYYKITVPVYLDGNWTFKEMPNVRPGYSYELDGPDQFTKVPVEIPANSVTTVALDIIYSQAYCHGCMVFLNEVLDRKIDVVFDVTSVYPINNEIRIEDIQ